MSIESSIQTVNGKDVEALIRAAAMITLTSGGHDVRLLLLSALSYTELHEVFNAHEELSEAAINTAVGELMSAHSMTGAEYVEGFHRGLHEEPKDGEPMPNKTAGGETIH